MISIDLGSLCSGSTTDVRTGLLIDPTHPSDLGLDSVTGNYMNAHSVGGINNNCGNDGKVQESARRSPLAPATARAVAPQLAKAREW